MATDADRTDETLGVFRTAGPGTPLTTSEVAKRLDLGRRAAYDRLERLAERDAIATKKVGARGRVWWLPPAGAGESTAPARDHGSDADPAAGRTVGRANGDGHPGSMLERLIGNVPGMVYRCENAPGWPMSFVSEGSAAVAGFDPAAIESGEVSWGEDVIHPADREQVREEVAAGLAEDGRFTLQYRIETADGDVRWVWERGCAVGAEDDVLEGVITDITTQMRTEAELAAETAFVESLLDAQPDIVYALGPDGTMRRWNDRLPAVTGYAEATLDGIDPLDLIAEADRERATDELAAVNEGGTRTVELGLRTADGDTVPYEFTGAPVIDDEGEVVGITGIGRDVSDRKARERRLRTERDEFEAELDEVFSRIDDAFYAVDEDFRFTYVNEQAEDLLDHGQAALLGREVWEVFPEAAETEAWDAVHTALETQEPTSYELYFDPLDFWVRAQVYPSETGLSVYFRDVTERKEREEALESQRERLTALNALNDVVREINRALVEQSSREEIERMVCERLAATDTYRFAWIGEPDPQADDIRVRAEAGVEGYGEDVSITLDADDPKGRGPAGRALRTHEPQVTTDALADPAFEPWRQYAEAYGYRSAAAIPIVHEETVYGLLAVYADHPGRFDGAERSVISGLGETIGHAIAAVERKQALTSEQVVELELGLPGLVDDVDLGLPADEAIVLENVVPVGDGAYVAFGATSPAGFDAIKRLADVLDQWIDVTRLDREGEQVQYELRLEEPPVLTAVVGHGGVFERATITEDEALVSVHLPPNADVRGFIETLDATTPGVELVTRRQRAREPSGVRLQHALADELTDRQRAALEIAYRAGYFAWPRESAGAEVADALDVSEPTFQQHLRTAESKVLGSLLE